MLHEDWSHFLCPKGSIRAWTSSRHTGISQKPFDSLNLSFEVGDDPLSVLENRKRFRSCLPSTTWIEAKQVHKNDIYFLHDSFEDLKPHPHETLNTSEKTFWAGEADILITRRKNHTLIIKHADCQPTLIYDSETKTIAAIHAGWRGVVGGAYRACMEAMTQKGCKAKNLKIIIGPSLQSCCAEFKNWQVELGKDSQLFEEKENHFNLVEMAFNQFQSLGVLKENVFMEKECTKCTQTDQESYKYFSYREKNQTGRHLTGIELC